MVGDRAVGAPEPERRSRRDQMRCARSCNARRCDWFDPRIAHRGERIDRGGNLRAAVEHVDIALVAKAFGQQHVIRSEEHTSELQSLMRISYAVFCLK